METVSTFYAVEKIKMVSMPKSRFLKHWLSCIKKIKLDNERFVELDFEEICMLKNMLDDFIITRDAKKMYDDNFCFEPYELDDGFWHSIIDIHTYVSSIVIDGSLDFMCLIQVKTLL